MVQREIFTEVLRYDCRVLYVQLSVIKIKKISNDFNLAFNC